MGHDVTLVPPYKTCSCGRAFSRVEYVALPLPWNGREFGNGMRWRVCVCGSTIAVEEPGPRCVACGEAIGEPVPESLPGAPPARFLCGRCGVEAGAREGDRRLKYGGATFCRYGSAWACAEAPGMLV